MPEEVSSSVENVLEAHPIPKQTFTLTIDTPSVFIWECPKCHGKFHGHDVLTVTVERFQGSYCLKCFAEWIQKTIPMLQRIDAKP